MLKSTICTVEVSKIFCFFYYFCLHKSCSKRVCLLTFISLEWGMLCFSLFLKICNISVTKWRCGQNPATIVTEFRRNWWWFKQTETCSLWSSDWRQGEKHDLPPIVSYNSALSQNEARYRLYSWSTVPVKQDTILWMALCHW